MASGPSEPTKPAVGFMLKLTLIVQAIVSIGLIVAAIILHQADMGLSDWLLLGVLTFWLGHINAVAQIAASEAPKKDPPNEG